ncbi:hypothetical protein [Reichenbachiella versicolor]|uniref:hypothetical protein n=1 Tax=Reichenbachiella versicolor TaxID=1821036 RepID=UPI000D6E113E|nr:hypothetical protein [Reichenbachiella versicolor]
MRVKWIEHKGKKILYCDYSGLRKSEQMLEVLHEVQSEMLKSNEPVCTISFVEGSFGSAEFMSQAKEFSKKNSHIIAKEAVLGIEGLKKILLNGYVTFTGAKSRLKTFDSEEEALDWLAES